MVAGSIDMGHARALLPLGAERQAAMARKITRLGWSVRQVERAVQAQLTAPPGDSKATIDLQTRWLQNQLARELGEAISIRPGANGEYVLRIGFANLAKLDATLQRLRELIGQIRQTAGPRAREAQPDAEDAVAGEET
jgi:ParB family chromosome partitioning protein